MCAQEIFMTERRAMSEWKEYEEDDDDWKHIWLRLDFMIDVVSFTFYTLVCVEKKKTMKYIFEISNMKSENVFFD